MKEKQEDQKELSQLKRALVAIKDMRAKLEASELARREPIAIVGMACRFPGHAEDLDSYWQLLSNGVDAVGEVPKTRWDIDAYYDPDPDAPGKMYMREGGFIGEVDKFDADFFGISPREAVSMDPQQRLLMEVTWEALENAGISSTKLMDTQTGVYVGIGPIDYSDMQLKNDGTSHIDAYVGTGGAACVAAGRLAYFLGIHGPVMAIDTACSSSLVAVDTAVQSLRADKCKVALAGGVSLMLAPDGAVYLSKVKALSPSGRCKAFDESADGYGRGEGCGMVVLKRLSDAQADGDTIMAVIRGSATNHDGRSSGLTVPNASAQQALIKQAVDDAGIEPGQIDYIEAHGTGTSLGDPIELRALNAVLGEGRDKEHSLLVGTVKTNIGHLEASAGVAGLIKVVLAMRHGEIPANLHFDNPSSHIPWDQLPITIPVQSMPWPQKDGPSLAGVSAFGFSGTNAHLIVEQAPVQEHEAEIEKLPLQLLTITAKNEAALNELAKRYETYIDSQSESTLSDVCYTSNVGRSHLDHRLAVLSDSLNTAKDRLSAFCSGKEADGVIAGRVPETGEPKVAFLFTGQGSQYVDMGRELMETESVFKESLEKCDELLRPYLEQSLLSVLYPDSGSETEAEDLLKQTAYTQPALFSLEYALAQLWMSWGIKPSAVMGHSVGEYVAACVAGVFNLDDAIKLIAERGRLMQALPKEGTMAAVFADEQQVAKLVQPFSSTVSIAALNGPENTVISGVEKDVDEILSQLKSEGIESKQLIVSHAFHSPLMEPMLDQFESVASEIDFKKPRIRLISNVTGQQAVPGEVSRPEYWREHVRNPVKFSSSIQSLIEQNHEILIEIGPHPVLLGMGRASLSDSSGIWLPSLRRGHGDREQILISLAGAYVNGVEVDWTGLAKGKQHQKVQLPTYPFQRERYWLDYITPGNKVQAPQVEDTLKDWLYELDWKPKEQSVSSESDTSTEKKHWLIFADRTGVTSALTENLRARGDDCITVIPGEHFEELKPGSFSVNQAALEDYLSLLEPYVSEHLTINIVYLWPLDADENNPPSLASLTKSHQSTCEPLLNLVKALDSTGAVESSRLWAVTRHVHSRQGVQAQSLTQGPLWGLGRVIASEFSALMGGMIDLDGKDADEDASLLAKELFASDAEQQVILRNKERLVARVVRKENISSLVPSFKTDRSYLITGGLGALGLLLARWLVAQGVRHLILVGRRQPGDAASALISELEESGAKIYARQGDVAIEKDVKKIVDETRTGSIPSLAGIIHAAGVLDDGVLLKQNWDRFAKVMAPKAVGAWNLHTATQDVEMDFLVLFSSLASTIGSPGQGNYAVANAFLDSLAQYRRQMGLATLSINWGPWSGIGMAADSDAQTVRRFESSGVSMIPPNVGLKIFAALLAQLDRSGEQVCVFKADWPKYLQAYAGQASPILFSEFVVKASEEEKQEKTSAVSAVKPLIQYQELLGQKRRAFLENYLQERIAKILSLGDNTVPLKGDFLKLGVDSLMIMELINAIKQDFDLTLFAREVFDRSSVSTLAEHLAAELDGRTKKSDATQEDTNVSSPSILPSLGGGKPRSREPVTKKNPGAIFLLSSPRAGSTLLRVMLAGHPDLFCPPELHLLPFDSMDERREALGKSFLDEGLQRALMELKGVDASKSKELVEELCSRDASIQEVYGNLQEIAGPQILVDKSPSYGADVNTLEAAELLFENPKYIHLVRHPYSVIESFTRTRMDQLAGATAEDPGILAERVWSEINANIMDFLENVDPGRHHLIYYEDLVKEPESAMRDLLSFLGLPFDEAVLSPYKGKRMTDGVHAQSIGIGDPNFSKHDKIDPNLADAWKKIRLDRRLGGFSQRLARELDYELHETQTGGVQMTDERQSKEVPDIKHADRSEDLPLSYAQQRIWVIEQMAPGNVAYNMPALVFRLKGSLKEEALHRSLTDIVQRHEGLRTTFRSVGGKPFQVITQTDKVPFKVVDLQHLAENERKSRAIQLATEEMTSPFDIEHGPLFRAVLFRLDKDDYILSIPTHHIVSDGWSLGVIIRELNTLYQAHLEGRSNPLSDLEFHYADYAIWQRDWLKGEVLQSEIEHWRDRLGNTPVLELPLDHPRPPVMTYKGDRESITIPQHLLEALKSLSVDAGATLFMTLLSAFNVLLSRYSNQEDIVVGSPIANRNRKHLEGIVGFFVNTLALRTDLSGNPTFRELLKRVREVTLDAYSHQDVPFEEIVNALETNHDMSRSPLFQVMFVLQNVSVPGLEFEDIESSNIIVNDGTSKFDLWLSISERENGLLAILEYNTDLFEQATVRRLLDHYQILLENIVVDPNREITKIECINEVERKQLITDLNATEKEYPDAAGLHTIFEGQAARTPDAIAVVSGDDELTYDALNRQANQLANYLIKTGVEPETMLGICIDRSVTMLVGLLGIMKAGGTYVPMDPDYPKERLGVIVEDAGIDILLTEQALLERLPAHEARRICIDTEWQDIAQQSDSNPETDVSSENLAYVIFTSGSTGRPKGVEIPHRALVNFLATMAEAPGFGAEDVMLALTTLSFDIAGLELYLPLFAGGRVVIISREQSGDGQQLAEVIAQHGVTVVQATPVTWRLLLDSGWKGKDDLKILCGGEAMPRDIITPLLERSAELWNMYGPTETTIWSTIYRVESADDPILIGHAIANTRVYVLDRHGSPAPIGVAGELYIGGDGLARGYRSRPELTEERFIQHQFDDGVEERLYRTGDLARWRSDGNLECLGRADNQVKVRGFRIELDEIEIQLVSHMAVNQSVVVVREDRPGDTRLVAYIVHEAGQSFTVTELRKHLRNKLPEYMIPQHFVELDELPLTPNGKIDRKSLPQPFNTAVASNDEYVAPRTETEKRLAEIWREVIGVERVGVNDNFFDLGGHSLLSIQAISHTKEKLGVQLSLQTMVLETLEHIAAQCERDTIPDKKTTHINRGFTGNKIIQKIKDTFGLS